MNPRLLAFAAIGMVLLVASVRAEPWVIGTYVEWPPWTIVQDSGSLDGFEIDLVHDLCRRMNRTCAVVGVPWADVFPLLDAGEIDAYLGGMSVTADRRRLGVFSRPYARMPSYFAVLADSTVPEAATLGRVDLDDIDAEEQATLDVLAEMLTGRVIAVHRDTTFEIFLRQHFSHVASIALYDSETRKLADFAAGRVDLILDNGGVLLELTLGQDPILSGLRLYGPSLVGGPLGAGIAVALSRSRMPVVADWNRAIEGAIADGSLAELAFRWFGFSVTP